MRREGDFDEGKDPARGYVNKDGTFGKLHGVEGTGDASTEAGLRYEINARMRMEQSAGRIGESEEDMKTKTTAFLNENPNATDHSTIVGHAMHAEKVIAYDVAVGWVNPSAITPKDLMALRQFADWRYLSENLLDTLMFVNYFDQGFINGHQLFRTYTMAHMHENAPQIVDKRKSNFVAAIH